MYITKPPVSVIFAMVGLSLLSVGAEASAKPSVAELAAITERGRILAQYDWVAWHATDAVMAAHPKADPTGRYIARKTDAGWVVDFGRLSTTGDAFLVVDEATQMSGSAKFQVKTFDAMRKDTGWNLSAARAIETASGDFGETNRPYNIAVLPAGAGGLYVYLYPAQTDAAVYPLGGDVRYLISPGGMKIVEKRQLHKSIIETPPASAGETVAGGYHVHVLSDLPEDTDVMFVLTRKPLMPEVILAGSNLYAIDVHGVITLRPENPSAGRASSP
jgi:hypothetical protein